MTLVGEPQNLLIGKVAGWDFAEFFWRMIPVTLPVLGVGLFTCLAVESTRSFGYGAQLSPAVRQILAAHQKQEELTRSLRENCALVVQGLAAVVLILALANHVAEIGLIGLLILVLATALNGVVEEQRLGPAFEAALPFTALLVVFCPGRRDPGSGAFTPFATWVLTLEGRLQVVMFFIASGLLSAISDNVFVGTVYITQVHNAMAAGSITREQFDLLAVAVNTGTNIVSVSTPNGQAGFLFLLTSALAPLIRLSYGGWSGWPSPMPLP